MYSSSVRYNYPLVPPIIPAPMPLSRNFDKGETFVYRKRNENRALNCGLGPSRPPPVI